MASLGGGEKQTLVLAEHLSKSHEVYLFTVTHIDRAYVENYFDVDLSKVKIVELRDPTHTLKWVPGISRLYFHRLHNVHYWHIREFKLDVFINYTYGSQLQSPAKYGIYMCMFPVEMFLDKDRLKKMPAFMKSMLKTFGFKILNRELQAYESYDVITAVSDFTAHWIEQIWGRTSVPVYAVCDPVGRGGPKEKIILNVGRFARLNRDYHHKRQDVMVNQFLKMTDLHKDGWQLHFVGSLKADDETGKEYADTLKAAAGNAPIHFHLNAPRDVLLDFHRRASIYWHATGYGNHADDSPHAQEHFGITTVESMSAGTVPVVIDSGGHRETVLPNVNGILWKDIEEMEAATRMLANDPELLAKYSVEAEKAGHRYDRAAFGARMDEILASL
ncbi:MAG: glycosyltransferase family 4 protein [Chthonomonadales bacterium]